MRLLRSLLRAFGGAGWFMLLPAGPYDAGYIIPMPREPESPGTDGPLRVPLSACEHEIFRRLTSAEHWSHR